MSTLRLDKVSKLFRAADADGGTLPALRQVSFGINPGEVVTLIGESGSGKTTLGKIVLRLITASSGQVLFDGKDIAAFGRAELHEYYRYVQGVFQDPYSSYNPVYKADRVFELLREEYFPKIAQGAWEARIDAALEAVALNPGEVLDRYPHQLSGGQQQRLLIARALLLDVKLLIADEIISMLDASTRVDVLNLLVGLKQAGLAVLFITHDLSLGHYISDRTVILRHGAIAEMGPTVQVFGNPQHPYTRMLLESVPQLHRRWSPRSAGLEAPAAAGEQAAAGSRPPARPRHRPPARQPRRGRPNPMLEPPPLTECEPGHLVAAAELEAASPR
ncbi:MAG TPA: ATP-binding cassette domain-containing protein [Streptosporangiaceae bacterium]